MNTTRAVSCVGNGMTEANAFCGRFNCFGPLFISCLIFEHTKDLFH